MVFMRLRAAEKALRDGRLDEAYRLATAADLRDHRRAGDIRGGLAEKLLERARSHFQADRFREALLDLDRAELGGVIADQVAELRRLVCTVAAEQQRKEDVRRERLRDAMQRVEDGSLAAGRRILEQASHNDHEAQELRRAIVTRADEVTTLLHQAERMMAQEQYATAAERVRKAKTLDAHHESVARLELNLCQTVLNHVRDALLLGKLNRGVHELAGLGELGTTLAAKRELQDALTLAKEAGRCLRENAIGEARRCLLSLQRLVPDAHWVDESIEQLRRLDEVQTVLAAGPLGDTAPLASLRPEPLRIRVPMIQEQTIAMAPRIKKAAEPLNSGLLLLVDGGGSYLILRGSRVSLGRAAADAPADIPLFTDLSERHAEIARMEEDYFLFSTRDVEVGGRVTRHRLLRDGDRVVLGRRGKLTFRLPSRQSVSAALDLSDTTKMPNDVRRIVLFDRHAIIGNGSAAHIRCRHAGTPLVMFERQGGLWVRPKSDGHVDNEAKPLSAGEPVEIGGVRMTLGPWRIKGVGESIT